MHSHSAQLSPQKAHDGVYRSFYSNATASRINTNEVLVEAIRKQYPELHLTITLTRNTNLLNYAAAGYASAIPVDADNSITENLKFRMYIAPSKRLEGGSGSLVDSIQFGKYIYRWNEHDYILYKVVGSDGPYTEDISYLLGTPETNDQLMLSAGNWAHQIHNAVLVFDSGYWQYSYELWRAVQTANWDDVILDAGMKKSVIGEITKFFDSRERYQKLRVPWKRGLIFHGPPGNGKTISIKAMMHSLYSRPDPTPTLYVRSLTSYSGPEYSLSQIFGRARQMAPCFLVFEDLDSIVTDAVRSYFLNEVDGLKNNDGILMVGSTNHMERLDPGISKRPSRFDRKYLFPDPNLEQRVEYCEFWRNKLGENDDIEFPERLNHAIAAITKGFSFAYIQEAFVAALLSIANGDADEVANDETSTSPNSNPSTTAIQTTLAQLTCACSDPSNMKALLETAVKDDGDLEQYVLWREIKKVIKTLREELEGEGEKERRIDYACLRRHGCVFET